MSTVDWPGFPEVPLLGLAAVVALAVDKVELGFEG